VLWESGAVLTYLVQEYDKNHTLTYGGGNKVHQINQWLFFQTSGQGPYFGQAAWLVLKPRHNDITFTNYESLGSRFTILSEFSPQLTDIWMK
jgi:glutathione S-transferase